MIQVRHSDEQKSTTHTQIKFHFKKKKITRQKKKQFHHYKVRYYMQSTKPHPKLPAPNRHCHASALTTVENDTSSRGLEGVPQLRTRP